MARRSFFLWSDEGSALFLAMKLQQEGNHVSVYIHDRDAKEQGRGLVPRTDDPSPPKGSIVLFDGVGHGAIGKFLRGRGQGVLGGNLFDRDLEIDRPKGASIMQDHGITIPETHAFQTIPQAQAWLKTHEGDWFVKLSGNPPESSTENFPTAASLSRYLEWVRRQPGVARLELQARVRGTLVEVEGWFDGTRFVPPFNVTLEDKRFGAGNTSVRTGCESNLVYALEDGAGLARQTLVPMTDTLREKNYVAPLALNMIVDEKGVPHGLEWTARLGFDALWALLRLMDPKFPLGEQLDAFVHGELEEWYLRTDQMALTLRVSIPPYPTDAPEVARRKRGFPLDPQLLHDDRFTVEDVMLGSDGAPVFAGSFGLLGTIGAVGTDLPTLRKEVLDLARGLDIRGKQFRVDPVARAERDLEALRDQGLLGNAALDAVLFPPPEEEDEEADTEEDEEEADVKFLEDEEEERSAAMTEGHPAIADEPTERARTRPEGPDAEEANA